jgi:hypothetical protein
MKIVSRKALHRLVLLPKTRLAKRLVYRPLDDAVLVLTTSEIQVQRTFAHRSQKGKGFIRVCGFTTNDTNRDRLTPTLRGHHPNAIDKVALLSNPRPSRLSGFTNFRICSIAFNSFFQTIARL